MSYGCPMSHTHDRGADAMRSRYSIRSMGNGLTVIRDRESGLQGCYITASGAYRHGDLRLPASTVGELLA